MTAKRKFGKRNEINLNPLAYNFCLLGEPKIGKTTLIKEYCEKLVGSDGYMFIELAGEAGADAIDGIIYEDADEWDDFEEIIDDIIDNRTTDYKDLRVICIDTYDGLINLAEDEAIRIWNIKNPDKRSDTIDGVWNGFQKGQKKAFELMFDVIVKLRKVGISTIIIGHVKNKELTDIASGTTYQTLTSDVEKIYFTLLKKKMHFLGLAYYDRKIVTEKTGKKNIVTKKDETVNKIADQTRKIKFRDDNMALDSGSRFADIVEEIPFDVGELINALNNAILAEHNKGGKTVEESKAEQEKAEAEKLKAVAKSQEENKKNKELKALISHITDFIKENKSDMKIIKPILEKSKELGFANPTLIDNVEHAQSIVDMLHIE